MERPKLRKTPALLATMLAAIAPQQAFAKPPNPPQHEQGLKTREAPPPATIDISRNTLSEAELETHRNDAVQSLIDALPSDTKLDYLRDKERFLAESQMYLPDLQERQTVMKEGSSGLNTLSQALAPDQHGLFGFAGADLEGNEYHRLYVIHKDQTGTLRFVIGYRVSFGEKGFGNKPNSGQTPVGLFHIRDGKKGLLGEVIVEDQSYIQYFKTTLRIGRTVKRFVSAFGHENIMEPATVVTERYTVDAGRGVYLHGSNRTGRWLLKDGIRKWVTYLGGIRRSGACGRMANADVHHLGQRYISLATKANPEGTPYVMYATPEIMRRY